MHAIGDGDGDDDGHDISTTRSLKDTTRMSLFVPFKCCCCRPPPPQSVFGKLHKFVL